MLAACKPAPPPSASSASPSPDAAAPVVLSIPPDTIKRLLASQSQAEVAQSIAQMRASARTEAERRLVERFAQLFEHITDGSLKPEAAYPNCRALVLDLAALAPDDLNTQAEATETLFALGARFERLSADDLTAEPMRRAEALLERFPKAAQAHELMASMVWGRGGDPLRVLRELRACHALDPTFNCDADLYQGAILAYEVPRCDAAELRAGFAVVLGTEPGHGEDAQPIVTLGTKRLRVADAPRLVASDVVAVAGGDGTVIVELTTEGLRKAHALVREHEWAIVLAEGKPAGGAETAFVEDRKLIIYGSLGDASAMCKHVERRRLPPELGRSL
jgi:hypothetical protein